MEAPDHNSPDRLCSEILAEGQRSSEQVLRRAREDAAALLEQTSAAAERWRQDRLVQARAEAARRVELTLATVPVEARRRQAAEVEALLEHIHERARHDLAELPEATRREAVTALAAEAIRQMAGDEFVVKIAEGQPSAIGNGLAEEITRRLSPFAKRLTVLFDTSLSENGPVVQDPEGRQVWDNRLLARLERLWPELRRQIAVRTSLVTEARSQGGRL